MMNRIFLKTGLLMWLVLISVLADAQTISLSGIVFGKGPLIPLGGVSVRIKNGQQQAQTDEKGRFELSIKAGQLPGLLVFSRLGYHTTEIQVSESAPLEVHMAEGVILAQEVVISASRQAEPIMESPVSIERVSGTSLPNSASGSFYDGLINLKGVEMSTQSMTFKSVNTRGFNADGNFRFNQFVDGMDNMAPGLNFSVGNIIGLSDLDLDYAELLPGASSALYGAGGTNGTLVMNSKDPFKHPGISFQYKQGITQGGSGGSASTLPYHSADLRLAKSWNGRFGIKAAYSFLEAEDWVASNNSNYNRAGNTVQSGDRSTDPNYDGVNVYGDEISRNMINVAQSVLGLGQRAFIKQYGEATGGQLPNQQQIDTFLGTNPQTAPFYLGLKTPGLLPNQSISRTGYAEHDLVDYTARNFKTSSAVYYNFANGIKAVAQANWGKGSAMYTGSDRYSLRNFSIGQYKLELSREDFLLRAYTTREKSGDSYVTSILGSYINEQSKASTAWFPEYIGTFIGAKAKGGISDVQAHALARAAADKGRFEPGTPAYDDAKQKVLAKTISSGAGAAFDDRSNLNHYEGIYNFSQFLNGAAELQVGLSARQYQLRSAGTIFDDLNRKLDIEEYGAFVIAGRKLLREKLKLTFAGRYDKNQNFRGRFSPRLTGVYTAAKNHHIRASYQTGFRNPTTQYQYLDLSAGGGSVRLIGGIPEMLSKYDLYVNKPYTSESYSNYLNSAALGKADPGLLQAVNFEPKGIVAETVHAFELGDKVLLAGNFFLDGSVYYNAYRNFISEIEVYQLNGDQVTGYNIPVNTKGSVRSYGGAIGFEYLSGRYSFTGNLSYNDMAKLPEGYSNDYGFNTPKIRFNIGVSNAHIWKNVGFSTVFRWQDSFRWSTPFVAGNVQAYGIVDGQLNYQFTRLKSMLKIGGNNLLNKRYHSGFGNPEVGAMYYVSVGYNL